jgi:hypothetical protein
LFIYKMIDHGCKPKPNGAKRSKCVKTCHTTEFDVIEYAPRPAMNNEPIPPLTGLTLIKYLPIDLRNLGVDNVRDVEYETAVLIRIWLHVLFQRWLVIRFCQITKTWLCTSIKCPDTHTYDMFLVDWSTNVLWSERE